MTRSRGYEGVAGEARGTRHPQPAAVWGRRPLVAGTLLSGMALLFSAVLVSANMASRRGRNAVPRLQTVALNSAQVAAQVPPQAQRALKERVPQSPGGFSFANLVNGLFGRKGSGTSSETRSGNCCGDSTGTNNAGNSSTGRKNKVITWKPKQPAAEEVGAASKADAKDKECFGFDKCPEFPLPYSYGQYPTRYQVANKFPEGFIWGMGTSAYQIEGAYREDGRGASIWDTFSGANTVGMPGGDCSYCCKQAPCSPNNLMFAKGATGNVACDHYHVWRSDVALMRSMGMRHYRFSISWPRLVPTGRVSDGINPKAIAFYNSLIDGLLASGITPYVTLYHWDLPQGLLDPPRVSGWWSRDGKGKPDGQILQDFVDYAEACFSMFGDRVKTWFTFNEPWTFVWLASGYGKAPSIPEFSNLTIDPYIAGHNVLNAHAAAVDLYRRKFQRQQGGKISISNSGEWREPITACPADVAAAERAMEFRLGWFSDPIFGGNGDYPPAMRRLVGERLPSFTAEQRQLLNGSADFYSLSHYGTGWVGFVPDTPGKDGAYTWTMEGGFPRALSSWLYGAGWGFRKVLNWVSRRYNRPPIYVTEGGWSLAADTADEGARDRERVHYYANYTAAMRQAIYEDGVDVRGYFAWSLLDNFEWDQGYSERFGTTFNDFAFGPDRNAPGTSWQPTAGHQRRQRKNSSCWLEAVWTANALVDPEGGAFQGCVSSDVFRSSFYDPKHPHCVRTITIDGTGKSGQLTGTSPRSGHNCDGATDLEWGPLSASFGGGTVVADFTSQGGPSELVGYWNRAADAIEWGDGVVWIELDSPPRKTPNELVHLKK